MRLSLDAKDKRYWTDLYLNESHDYLLENIAAYPGDGDHDCDHSVSVIRPELIKAQG